MTDLNSGYKQVDLLARSNGISAAPTENNFQLAIDIPKCNNPKEVCAAISPFGLEGFPNTMWLALQRFESKVEGLILHRFSLPSSEQVICWALMDCDGNIVEKAFPMNKPKYVKAAKSIVSYLSGSLSH